MIKEKKKNKTFLNIILFLLLIVLLLVFFGFVILKFSKPFPDQNSFLLIAKILFISYFATFLQIIIHEAGHLVFGLLSGYKFSSFRIFNLMWLKENGKIKLKKFSLAGTGGQCLMVPPEIVDGKLPVFLYNMGGAFMNIIVSLISLVLFFIFTNFPFLSFTLILISLNGALTALLNGFPLKNSLITNDGYNAISLRKDPDALKAFWLQMKMNEQVALGSRLKDMPAEWFTVPTDEQMKNTMISAIGVFACNRMMEEKRFQEADSLMEHFLKIDSSIVGIHRNLLICDRMYCEMISNNRKDIIDKMLTKQQKEFMQSMKNFASVIRTEYTYALLVEKNSVKAKKIKAKFDEVSKTYPYQCDIQSEKELIEIAEKLV